MMIRCLSIFSVCSQCPLYVSHHHYYQTTCNCLLSSLFFSYPFHKKEDVVKCFFILRPSVHEFDLHLAEFISNVNDAHVPIKVK